MMHHEQIVVALLDNNKKPLREFDSRRQDNGRKCSVYIPEETEYQFLVKNNLDRRIKINIDIDGTNVSGNGLILDANCTDYIERFVDVNKKFKAVKKTDERVSDPSNPENGIIKVRIQKERKIYPTLTTIQSVGDYWVYKETYDPTFRPHITWLNSVLRGCNNSDAIYGNVQCCYNASTQEPLATVEGSISNQQFTSTTWNGDEGITQIFTFYLKATSQEVDKEYQEYLRLKQKYS